MDFKESKLDYSLITLDIRSEDSLNEWMIATQSEMSDCCVRSVTNREQSCRAFHLINQSVVLSLQAKPIILMSESLIVLAQIQYIINVLETNDS